MKRKKILFVIESLQLGGGEKSLVTLLHNLDYEGLEVDLLLFNRGGIFEKFLPEQVRILEGKNPRLNLIDRILYKSGKIVHFGKLHEAQLFWKIAGYKTVPLSGHYDVAIAYNQQFPTYFVAEKVNAAKKLAWMNTLYISAGYNADFDWPYFQKFSTLVGVSAEAVDSLNSAFKTAGYPLNTALVKDIIDTEMIARQAKEPQPIPFSGDSLNIVTVCRLAPPKGLEIAIGAAELLHQKGINFRWYVIGEGSERPHLEQLIAKKGLTERFLMPGSTDNPYPYMKNCDIYVQTSLVEGLGMSVIEAVILQKPVVCTNFDTAAAIVTEDDRVVPKDAKSVFGAILYFMENPSSRKRTDDGKQIIDLDKNRSLTTFKSLIS